MMMMMATHLAAISCGSCKDHGLGLNTPHVARLQVGHNHHRTPLQLLQGDVPHQTTHYLQCPQIVLGFWCYPAVQAAKSNYQGRPGLLYRVSNTHIHLIQKGKHLLGRAWRACVTTHLSRLCLANIDVLHVQRLGILMLAGTQDDAHTQVHRRQVQRPRGLGLGCRSLLLLHSHALPA